MLVEQPGRARQGVADVPDFPAAARHLRDIVDDVAGDVGGRILVLAALAVNLRAHGGDRLDRRRVRHDHDEIHAGQRGQAHRAQHVIEQGPPGTLVHMRGGGHRDHQHVTKRGGLLEVKDVAGMDQVEGAVALDQPPARAAQFREPGGCLREGDDFVGGVHRERKPVHPASRPSCMLRRL